MDFASAPDVGGAYVREPVVCNLSSLLANLRPAGPRLRVRSLGPPPNGRYPQPPAHPLRRQDPRWVTVRGVPRPADALAVVLFGRGRAFGDLHVPRCSPERPPRCGGVVAALRA